MRANENKRFDMAVQIPCPKCGAVLKLPDRSLLGRTGKCPKCSHRFTLADPDEVELELIAPAAEEPLKPVQVRRVHDESPASEVEASTAVSPVPSAVPAVEAIPTLPPPVGDRLQRRRSRGQRTEIVVGGIVALLLVAAIWGVVNSLRNQPSPWATAEDSAPTQSAGYQSERDRLQEMAKLIVADRPTQGEPITLRYIPAGASIIIHLRPAELWRPGSTGEELRYCLGDRFGTWLQSQLERYCLLPPTEIEEATISLNLGARGSEPAVASVVRPVTPLKTSELIQRFDGSPESYGGIDIFVGPERSYVIGQELDDQKRPTLFATATAEDAESLAESVVAPSITSDDVEQLLKHTDRGRHFTIVFRPSDLRIHEETLAATDLRDGWNELLDRLGGDVEAAAWSGHLDKQTFYSELLARNSPAVTPAQLLKTLRGRLDRTPTDLVSSVERMKPSHVGDRKLIGRFPAMMQLFAMATVGGIDDRLVLLQTELPERAGPNLALAGLLTWNEATRTDFKAVPAAPEPSGAPSGPIARRLEKPIEIDFRRTPLEEAFMYIGSETDIVFEIDGDALKLAGYTRNMPQTLSLGKVRAERGVAEILSQYDKMVVVIDDSKQTAIVTTKAVAAEKGLTPATFSAN